MKQLHTGQFHGQTNRTIQLNGITLTDTEYTQEKVDWHYHENAYFTLILQGEVMECNKKEEYHCSAGSLLFHNWQEPHYNVKPGGFTRGFHIELEQQWLDGLDFNLRNLSGSINISNPDIKLLVYKIVKETRIEDITTSLSVQNLLLQLLDQMLQGYKFSGKKNPLWVNKIKEILHDQFSDKLTLADLSAELDIHPVHLSRDFPKYFHCSLGTYIRKLKIEKSLSLLSKKNTSLSDITFDCGFSDQSHFTRCFKEVNGIKPLEYRKLIFS
jgi:AraC family transcriptional regulator